MRKDQGPFGINHINKVTFQFLKKGEFEHIHPEERSNNEPIYNDWQPYLLREIQSDGRKQSIRLDVKYTKAIYTENIKPRPGEHKHVLNKF